MKQKQIQLWEYVARQKHVDPKFNISKFAKDVGVHRSRMSRIISGKGMPSIKSALKIYEITEGCVDIWEHILYCSRYAEEK